MLAYECNNSIGMYSYNFRTILSDRDMLRISIDKLIRMVEAKRRKASEEPNGPKYKKLTIGEISEGSDVHRNIVSKILNNPSDHTSTLHISKIVEFFFYEIRKYDDADKAKPIHHEQLRLRNLFGLVFDLFPEKEEHKEFLDSLEQAPSNSLYDDIDGLEPQKLEAPMVWRMYYTKKREEQPELYKSPADPASGQYDSPDPKRKKKSKKEE